MDRWANKVALVTGAGSGIGAQIARDLCALKIIVVGLDFIKEDLDKVASEIKSNDSSVEFTKIYCDLTKEEEIKTAFDRIIAEKGGVDILVNCAGILTGENILDDDSYDAINRVIQTNLVAVISCVKKAFKSMSDRDVDGHIVNLCSVWGQAMARPFAPGGRPHNGAYCISKYGVKVLNRAIGQELIHCNKPNIRISNISPGFVGETGIFRGTDFKLPTRQTLKPKDISDTLMFILSAPSHVQVREVIVESVGGNLY